MESALVDLITRKLWHSDRISHMDNGALTREGCYKRSDNAQVRMIQCENDLFCLHRTLIEDKDSHIEVPWQWENLTCVARQHCCGFWEKLPARCPYPKKSPYD